MMNKRGLMNAVQELPAELHSFYIDLAKDGSKEFIRGSNAFLNQTIAINAALLAGSVAMWERIPLPIAVKSTIVIIAIVNTLICFCAAVPLRFEVSIDEPEIIRFQLEKLARRKLIRIRYAATVTIIGMVAGAAGLSLLAFES